MATAPDTVTEAVALLRTEGYTTDYELIDGVLRSDAGCPTCVITDAIIEHLYRFEGDSDPGDEMIVLGLHDPASDTRGTLATAFGHAADPTLAAHVRNQRT